MQSRAATSISRNDRAQGNGALTRPSGAPENRGGDFSRGLDGAANLAGASLAPAAAKAQQPAGRGLLSTGVQFILAETRTQEAGAPLPPPSSLGRARDSYLTTQASVRETIAINRSFNAPQQGVQSGGAQVYQRAALQPVTEATGVSPEPGLQAAGRPSASEQFDDEFDSQYY